MSQNSDKARYFRGNIIIQWIKKRDLGDFSLAFFLSLQHLSGTLCNTHKETYIDILFENNLGFLFYSGLPTTFSRLCTTCMDFLIFNMERKNKITMYAITLFLTNARTVSETKYIFNIFFINKNIKFSFVSPISEHNN